MLAKHGLDKYLSPHGFWDEFITGNILGMALLFINWLRFPEVAGDAVFFNGLLIGLLWVR